VEATLARLHDLPPTSALVQQELSAMVTAAATVAQPSSGGEAEGEGARVAWSELWNDVSVRRRVLIAVGLQWAQQLSGLNSIITFGSLFFRSAGLGAGDSLTGTLITDAAGLAGTIYLVCRIDTAGRRWLLIAGAAIMSVGWLGVGLISTIYPPYPPPAAEAAGAEGEGEGGGGAPTWVGLLVVFLICVVQVGFGIGWGAVPWVFPAEIFPMRIKEQAMSCSVFSQYASNFLLLQCFPIVTQWIGPGGSCIWFGCNMALAGVWVWMCVPETAGVPLEGMEKLFATGLRTTRDGRGGAGGSSRDGRGGGGGSSSSGRRRTEWAALPTRTSLSSGGEEEDDDDDEVVAK